LTWTDAIVTTSNPSFDCGPITFTITNTDTTAFDATVFTATLSNVVGSTQTFSTQTDVSAKKATYNLRVTATFDNYSTNTGFLDFTIVINDDCETPSLTASSLSNEVYVIHKVKQTTPAFTSFLNSPTYCPITYAIAISPSLPASDPAAITLDSPNRQVSFESIDPASE